MAGGKNASFFILSPPCGEVEIRLLRSGGMISGGGDFRRWPTPTRKTQSAFFDLPARGRLKVLQVRRIHFDHIMH
jgi:hypothetical protein